MDAGSAMARRAVRMITADPTRVSLADLAARLGITGRQLRRIFEREYGVPPVRYLRTARLLLAKNLLTDTRLPITEIAFTAGFGSVRRFNEVFAQHYRLAPSRFRKAVESRPADAPDLTADVVTLTLGYRPPLDWDGLLRFLEGRAIGGVEQVEGPAYRRTVRLERAGTFHVGWVSVRPAAGKPDARDQRNRPARPARPAKPALAVSFPTSLLPVAPMVLDRVRSLFDLDAQPAAVARRLESMTELAPGLNIPGIRLPGAFDGFEVAVRAVLGQQVNVKAARTVATRLAEHLGEPVRTGIDGLTRAFPDARRIAGLRRPIEDTFGPLGITGARANAIGALAQAVVSGQIELSPAADVDQTIQRLSALPGFGPWTTQYVAMRALSWPDAFPYSDYGVKLALRRVLDLDSDPPPGRILELADAWKPWRAYATMNLWRSLE